MPPPQPGPREEVFWGTYAVKDRLVIPYAPDGTVFNTNLIFKIDADIWIGSEVLGMAG